MATFGKYEIGREIGRGAMGVVYEAKDPTLRREIALKVVHLPESASPAARRRAVEGFYREGRALASLSHPNIVSVLDMGEVEGRCYLALELLRGTTLRDRLAYQGPLPVFEVARVGISICQALEHMHQRGIIHRDLKPDNIMLLPDPELGGTPRIKLTDFGVALAAGGMEIPFSTPSSPEPRSLRGSPAYMSPEQLLGLPLDGRSDLFSLGVTLYEAATGHRPFEADTLPALAHKVVHESPAPAPSLPLWLQGVLARAMARDPKERYPDAACMAVDLQRQQFGPAVPFPSPAASPPPRPAVPLNPDWDPNEGGRRPGVGYGFASPRAPEPLNIRTPEYPNSLDPTLNAPTISPGSLFPSSPYPQHPLSQVPPPYAQSSVPYPLHPPPYPLPDPYGNSSGMGSGAPVPQEIAHGWNWGAFTLPLFWSIANRTWIGLLCLASFLCPMGGIILSLIIGLVLGAYGNQWAWQNRQWESVEHFRQTQRVWATWGLSCFVAGIILGILVLFLVLNSG
jgi:serine/threonine protein kinase